MTTDETRIEQDLAIVNAMSDELDDYLRHDVLFWPMSDHTMPRLTLGGLLMRLHRLTAIRSQLTEEQAVQLDKAITQANHTFIGRTVALEKRATEEIEARLRQWQNALRDAQQGNTTPALYATSAEIRAILAALLEKMNTPPYQLDPQLSQRLQGLDQALRSRWQKGDFVWPAVWQPAYPQESYWWLYGLPQ